MECLRWLGRRPTGASAPLLVLVFEDFGELGVDVVPFAQAGMGEEAGLAGAAEFVGGESLGLVVVPVPQLEEAEEVGMLVAEGEVGGVGGLLLVEGAFSGVLDGEGGGDDEDFFLDAFGLGGDDHAGDARINGEAGELVAEGGELLFGGDGAEFEEGLVAVGDEFAAGGIEEGELFDGAEAEGFHLQDDGGEVGAEDFGFGEEGSGDEVFFGVEADADAGGDAAAASHALVGGGLGDGFDGEALDFGAGGVAGDSCEAGVDDEADAGDGEGGFGDVGGEDDAAMFGGFEDEFLLGGGEACEEGEDVGFVFEVAFEFFGGFADFAFAGEEDQNVAGAFFCDFVDGGDDGLEHVGFFFVEFLLFGALAVFFDFDELGGVGVVVAEFDGVGAAAHHDDGGVVEVAGERFGVDGGGGDEEFEVGAFGDELLQVAQEEVHVEGAYVGFVEDEGVVLVEEAVAPALRLGEEDAVGHELDVIFFGDVVGEADFEADVFADFGIEFLGDAGGDAAGGDAARLGVADHAGDAAAELEADLGELRGFARSRFAADDDDLVVIDDGGEFFALGGDGEFGGRWGGGGFVRGVCGGWRRRFGFGG